MRRCRVADYLCGGAPRQAIADAEGARLHLPALPRRARKTVYLFQESI